MRILLVPATLVAGLLTGVAAVAVHGRWWGLALAVVAVLVALVAVGPGWTTRVPFAVGFTLVLARLAVPRPEGDFMVAANTQGYLLLGLSLVVVAVALATLPRPGRGRGHGPAGTGP